MKKIFAMLVMTLFMISMVPASFADNHGLHKKVIIYVKENAEKLESMGLKKCIAHISSEFTGVGKKAATEYCKVVGQHRMSIKMPQSITKKMPLKANNKIGALNIAQAEKEKLKQVKPKFLRKFAALPDAKLGKVAKLKQEVMDKFGRLSRARMKAIAGSPVAIGEAEINAAIEEDEAIKIKAKRKRLVPRLEKVNAIKARDDAREVIRLEKIGLEPIKKKFLSLKPKIKACVGDSSAGCIKTREDMAEQSKFYLKGLIKLLEKNLDKVRQKSIASEHLTDEQLNTIKTEWYRLQEMIDKIKEEVNSITAKSDKTEINGVIQNVKMVTKEVKKFVRKVQTLFQEKKVVNVLARFDALEKRLEVVVKMMEERGIPIEKFDELIDAFSNNVHEARVNYKNALIERQAGNNEEAMSYFAISKGAFKKAHVILKEIIKLVKAAGWDIQASPIAINEYSVDEKDIAVFSDMIVNQENLRKGHDLNMDGSVDVADVVKLTSMLDILDAYLSQDGKLDRSDAEVFAEMITVAGNVDLGGSPFDINEDGTVDVRDLVKFNNILKNFDLA